MKDRRSFLKTLAIATAGIMVPYKTINGAVYAPADRLGTLLPLRKFGKTNVDVTMLGIGGGHIAFVDEKTAEQVIERSLEGGIRFFDNAEFYGDGLAEVRYGKYLTPKYRDVAFIMSKTRARDRKTAQAHLEQTLRSMKTDYIDLWQMHAIPSAEDVDLRIKQGVIEYMLEAKESGKVKHIGFTGHNRFDAHQHVLAKTDVFECSMMPINCFDPNYKSYIKHVLPTLVEREMGVIAMKTLGNGGFFGGTEHFLNGDEPRLVPKVVSVKEALHFAWSLPVSTLVTGPNDLDMLNEKIALAKSFRQMNEDERMELVNRVGAAGFDGTKVEHYKT